MARIIVVDKDPGVLALIHRTLKELGHEVIVASTIQEGMILCIFWRPVDMVMTDIFLSDVNGFDLMAKIIRYDDAQREDGKTEVASLSKSPHIYNQNMTLSMDRRLGAREIMARPGYRRALRGQLALAIANRHPVGAML